MYHVLLTSYLDCRLYFDWTKIFGTKGTPLWLHQNLVFPHLYWFWLHDPGKNKNNYSVSYGTKVSLHTCIGFGKFQVLLALMLKLSFQSFECTIVGESCCYRWNTPAYVQSWPHHWEIKKFSFVALARSQAHLCCDIHSQP